MAAAGAALLAARLPAADAPPGSAGLAHLPGVDLWYSDTGGSGETVVLLHPLTGSGHVWEHQQPALARAGYRVIAYSRRGFRGSSAGPADRPGTGADDLQALADRLGLDRFHVVGTAGGAFVAAAFAASRAARVRTLTLACSIVRVKDAALDRLVAALGLPMLDRLPADLRELGPTFRATDPAGHARWQALAAVARPDAALPAQPSGPPVTRADLARMVMPVLLMAGEADLIAPPPIARLLAGMIPRSELVLLPECGHSAYWERPDLFNAALLRFLRRHVSGG